MHLTAEESVSAEAATLPRYSAHSRGLKPLLLLVGVAAAVAAGVMVVLWSRGPSYSLLYANLGTEDQAQIAQALDAAAFPTGSKPARTASPCPPSASTMRA